ncbi:hypothetical protein RUMHYD_03365 [Blautia hydrogenotrophica DSM 10507]|uniref:Uncharacterized protein n=1 Tax=Blautia hydrogenotrophica (strain DSM 10507 / JCM 14656 / S5a33) TaxID=476272 RepID=C0CR52_BLAHS|nr:hypothetical protein RUMHYD_03365 [Blautia hydrogenotrophica DSM 10507]
MIFCKIRKESEPLASEGTSRLLFKIWKIVIYCSMLLNMI